MRTRVAAIAAIALTLLVTALSDAPATAAPAPIPPDAGAGAYRDPSGVLVVGDRTLPVPENLRESYGVAYAAAQAAPEAFGLPRVASGAVELPALSAARSTGAANTPADPAAISRVIHSGTSARDRRSDELAPPDALLKRYAGGWHETATDLSFSGLLELNDSAFALREDPRFAAAGIWASETDQLSGAIVLSVTTLTPELARYLVSTYRQDRVRVRVAPAGAAMPAGRQNDTSPYYGGAKISLPDYEWCTSGFAWRNGSSNMLLTAGHCIPGGGSVYSPGGVKMGTVTVTTRENWSASGTTKFPNETVYRGDLALAAMSSGQLTSARIFVGDKNSSTSRAVGEMWSRSPVNGDQYCVGGINSGETCGWKVDAVNLNQTYSDGSVLRNGTRGASMSVKVVSGDSGGPVYTVLSSGKVAAKGITSGSGTYLLWNQHFFTDIRQAFLGLPGTLAVS